MGRYDPDGTVTFVGCALRGGPQRGAGEEMAGKGGR
jgi:hypothetical protein